VSVPKHSGKTNDNVFAEKFTRRANGFELDNLVQESRVKKMGVREAISIVFWTCVADDDVNASRWLPDENSSPQFIWASCMWFKSGWQDLNLRPLRPEFRPLAKLWSIPCLYRKGAKDFPGRNFSEADDCVRLGNAGSTDSWTLRGAKSDQPHHQGLSQIRRIDQPGRRTS